MKKHPLITIFFVLAGLCFLLPGCAANSPTPLPALLPTQAATLVATNPPGPSSTLAAPPTATTEPPSEPTGLIWSLDDAYLIVRSATQAWVIP